MVKITQKFKIVRSYVCALHIHDTQTAYYISIKTENFNPDTSVFKLAEFPWIYNLEKL